MTEFVRPEPAPLPPIDAIVRAGRRRRAVVTATGGAVATALAVVVTVAGGPAGTSSLEPTGPATESAQPTDSATPSPETSETPAAEPTADPAPSPEPTGSPAEEPEPAPSPHPTGPPREYPHHSRMESGTSVSNQQPGVAAGPWTARVSVSHSDPGYPDRVYYFLRVAFCANAGAQALDFATEQEADFAVVDDNGRELWRWSRGQDFAAEPHTDVVAANRCLWWKTQWHGVTDGGRPLDPDLYTLRAYVVADGLADEPVAEMDVEVYPDSPPRTDPPPTRKRR